MADGRASKTIEPLLREFPASSALAGDLPVLEGFLREPAYERCMREGGSFALAFGIWLEAQAADEALRAMASLETAMARLRRRTIPSGTSGERLTLSPLAEIVERPRGTFELHGALLERMGVDPLKALVGRRISATDLPRVDAGVQEALLLLLGEQDPSETFRTCRVLKPGALRTGLLIFAGEPRFRKELVEEARALGAAAAQADELIDNLVSAGLLQRAP